MSIARLKNPNPDRCPLCGNINDCGVAAGQESCWCFTEPVPPEILKTIPADARGIACVCRRCVSSQRALTRALEEMSDLLRDADDAIADGLWIRPKPMLLRAHSLRECVLNLDNRFQSL